MEPQRRYMRISTLAQSWASVPLVPTCMSRNASWVSISPGNMRLNSASKSRVDAGEVLFDRRTDAFIGISFSHVETVGCLVETGGHPVERAAHHDRELAVLATEFLGTFWFLRDGRVLQFPQDFGEPLALPA